MIRNSGTPTTASRMMIRMTSGPELVITRSSMMTGRPLEPLSTALSDTSAVTVMVSEPAAPATQPPTATLVFALSIACGSEQAAPVDIAAASGGVGVSNTHVIPKTTLISFISIRHCLGSRSEDLRLRGFFRIGPCILRQATSRGCERGHIAMERNNRRGSGTSKRWMCA
jgi:hypothetical protein